MKIMRGRLFSLIAVVAVLTLGAGAVLAQLSADAKFVKAVKDGDMREIQMNVVNGGNVNARDASGMPVLVIAAKNGMASLVKYLVDNGAFANAEARETGMTALMFSAEFGDARVIRLLVAEGADVDGTDRRGETALMKAAQSGKRSAAKALLELGADHGIEDYTGRTALQIARNNRRIGVVDAFKTAGVEY